MTMDFQIYDSAFLALFGLYLVFFAVLWSVSYVLKFARSA